MSALSGGDLHGPRDGTAAAGRGLAGRDGTGSASLSLGLVLLTTIFIVYGSLYPFSFVAPPAFSWPSGFVGRWWAGSRGDMLANVALFVPFGFFAALFFVARRQVFATSLLLLFGVAVAVAVQVAQIFLPSRTAAPGDVLWNTVGIGAGYLLGRFGAAATADRFSDGAGRWRWSAGTIMLGVVAFEWLPFIPTLDFQAFKDNLKPLFAGVLVSVPELVLHVAVLFIGGLALREATSAGTRHWLFTMLTLAVLVGGRAFLVAAGLQWNAVLGLLAALLLLTLVWRRSEPMRVASAMWVIFAALILGGLWPFTLKSYATTFGWMPFEGFLSGDALATARNLLGQALLFFAFFVVIERARGALVAATCVLGLTMLGIEWAQLYLQGRSGEITVLVLVIGAAVLARAFGRSDEVRTIRPHPQFVARPAPAGAHQAMGEGPLGATGERTATWRTAALTLLGGIGLMTLALWIVLRAPNLPYNVRELFRFGGSALGLVLFSAALLFPGLASRSLGRRLEQSRQPWLELPFLVFAAGVLQLGLLYASVTEESIGDIAGSNNTYWFVINRDAWGAWGKQLFLALDSPALVSFFERPIRFAALYGPLVVVLAWLFALSDRLRRGRLGGWWFFSLTLCAVMVMWLCKFVAFDNSSSDNLNELIARDGFFGAGGGAYLYALLLLVCCNVWAIATVPSGRPQRWMLVALLVALSLPAGWALLELGLEPRVEKYGQFFSGQQFLLGPDRKQLLPDSQLMMRWWLVQIGFVAVSGFAARVGSAFLPVRRSVSRVSERAPERPQGELEHNAPGFS